MIKTTKVEIYGHTSTNKEYENWIELVHVAQRIMNYMWAHWRSWHFQNGSEFRIAEHFAAPESERGNFPVHCIPTELNKHIYESIGKLFPQMNSRPRDLLLNRWKSTVKTRKSARGSRKGWVAILLAEEAIPTFTRPHPVPFDNRNGKLRFEDGKYILSVRLDRRPEDGTSSLHQCYLRINKRKCGGVRAIIERIASGEYVMKGSSISFSRGKWFANIAYEIPAASKPNSIIGRKLQLIPGKRSPWVLRYTNESGHVECWRHGGRGGFLAMQRRNLVRERRQRSEHYRWAGSNQKGHGRSRADSVWTKLSSRWRDLVKRYNNEVTKRLVVMAKQRGIATIHYHQPIEKQRDRTFLTREGRPENSPMTWDWFQVGTLLAAKCEEAGIEFTTVKTSNDVPSVRRGNGSKSGKRIGKKAANMS